MPEPDLEGLRQKILDDLEQLDLALKREHPVEERRPVLRLLKGGLVGGAILAGVEWFRDYKRIGVALVAAGITVTAAVVVDQEAGLPGADPPPRPSITAPTAAPRHSIRPTVTPTPSTPPRASPLRKLGSGEPTSIPIPTPEPPRTRPPRPTPTMLITTTVTPPPITVTPPVTVIPTIPTIQPTCPALAVGELLKLNLCLLLG